MKKILGFLLTLSMVFCTATSFAQESGTTPVKINGETKNLVAYNIKYNNYFKLRDLANVLKGTRHSLMLYGMRASRRLRFYQVWRIQQMSKFRLRL